MIDKVARPASKAGSILFFTVFLDLLGYGIVVPLLPEFARDFGATPVVVGLLVASYSFAQLLGSPVLGGLSDRFGRRPLLLASIAVNATSFLIFAWSGSLLALFAARLVSGFAAGNLAVVQAYLSDVTPPDRRAKAFGMIGAATGLGFVFGPPLGGWITANYGVAAVGLIVAGLCGLNLLLTVLLLPETRKPASGRNPSPFSAEAFVRLRETPSLARLFTIYALFISGFAVLTVVGALLWIDRFGLSDAEVGYTFGVVGIVMAVAQGLIGPLVARTREKTVLVAGLLLMAAALASMPIVPVADFFPREIASIAVFALGYAFAQPTGTALVADAVAPELQGQVLGQYQAVAALGRILGPLIGGFAYQITPALPFFMGAALIVLAFVAAAGLPARSFAQTVKL
jgi:MFS transporter, DHA1 family, tetracycline resistance protein